MATAGLLLGAVALGLTLRSPAPDQAVPVDREAPTPHPHAVTPVPTPTEDRIVSVLRERTHAVGYWSALPAAPISPRANPVVAWTGREGIAVTRGPGEVIVWGGQRDGISLADGAAYDPKAGVWRRIATAPYPTNRWALRTATWTGTELVALVRTADDTVGLAYDPETDHWRETASPPDGLRSWQAAGWSGEEMIAFAYNPGLRAHVTLAYDPDADAWRGLAPRPVIGDAGSILTTSMVDGIAVVGTHGDTPSVTLLDQHGSWTEPERLPAALPPAVHSVTTDVDADRLILVGRASGRRTVMRTWSWSTREGWRALPNLEVGDATRRATLAWSAGHAMTWLGRRSEPGAVLPTRPSERWHPMAPPPLGSRDDAAVTAMGRGLFVWGGRGDGGLLDDGATFIPWSGVADGRLRAGN